MIWYKCWQHQIGIGIRNNFNVTNILFNRVFLLDLYPAVRPELPKHYTIFVKRKKERSSSMGEMEKGGEP